MTYTWYVTTKDEFNSTLSQQSFQFLYRRQPVPITLASFSGTFVGNGRVRLDWQTLSEYQNLGFEIQKSRSVPTLFTTIPNSFVPGHGTTNVPQNYTFTDSNATPGLWYYRLKQLNQDGTFTFVEPIAVQVVTSAGEETPTSYSLSQNYPNPFNPSTKIDFTLKTSGFTTLKVYNLLGQEVATLVNGSLQAGRHSVELNAESAKTPLTSGIYFYKLISRPTDGGQAGNFRQTKKMILVK
jgi:hypothetical protein